MPQGKYTDKQERKAKHIEESCEDKGVSEKEAKSRAWATVNKQDGGGKKPGGSGVKKSRKSSAKKTTSSKKTTATKTSTSRKRAPAGRKGGKARAKKAA